MCILLILCFCCTQIKSPSDGRLLGILVQADDTVVPGQLVATVDDSSPAVAPQPAGPAAPHPAKQPEPSASAAAPAGAPAAGGPLSNSKRVPGILFPPRIAPDGRRISALPASEAHALLTQLQAGAGAVPQPQAAAPAAAPAPSLTSASPEAPRRATVSWLADTPGKRQLTDSEIDMIMLGGAS